MSPIAANDTETTAPPEEERTRAKSGNKPGPKAAPREEMLEMGLPEAVLRPTLPITRARVCYLGPGDTHAITMKGQVSRQFIEDPDGTVQLPYRERDEKTREWVVDPERMVNYTVLKEAVDEGMTQYDFTYRDSRGQLIREKLAPETLPEKARNRPFVWCEHIDHLRNFELARDARGEKLYYISATPALIPIISEHIKKTARERRATENLFNECFEAGQKSR